MRGQMSHRAIRAVAAWMIRRGNFVQRAVCTDTPGMSVRWRTYMGVRSAAIPARIIKMIHFGVIRRMSLQSTQNEQGTCNSYATGVWHSF